ARFMVYRARESGKMLMADAEDCREFAALILQVDVEEGHGMRIPLTRIGKCGVALASLAVLACLSGQAQSADFDQKPNVYSIMGQGRTGLAETPSTVGNMSPAPAPSIGPAAVPGLPKGLPSSSSVAGTPAPKALDNLPPPPGPLGLKNPHGYVDATRQKP